MFGLKQETTGLKAWLAAFFVQQANDEHFSVLMFENLLVLDIIVLMSDSIAHPISVILCKGHINRKSVIASLQKVQLHLQVIYLS